MRNVLILSFMHHHNMILKEFELLKTHYQKLIDYYKLPMQYYGVLLTDREDVEEYFIDHNSKIIWLKSQSVEEDDKDLYKKVIAGFKVIEKEFEYDVVVKSNTSFLINLLFLNSQIQNTPDIEHCILTSLAGECKYVDTGLFIGARGNCMVMHKNLIQQTILKSDTFPPYTDQHMPHHVDDQRISYILRKDAHFVSLGQYSISQQDDVAPHNTLEYVDDIFNVPGITIKTYDAGYAKRFKDADDSVLMFQCTDVILLRLFINQIESRFLPEYRNIIRYFHF